MGETNKKENRDRVPIFGIERLLPGTWDPVSKAKRKESEDKQKHETMKTIAALSNRLAYAMFAASENILWAGEKYALIIWILATPNGSKNMLHVMSPVVGFILFSEVRETHILGRSQGPPNILNIRHLQNIIKTKEM